MRKNSFAPLQHNKRTCKIEYSDYRQYKEPLKKDFNSRCGYCGSSCEVIQDFEIDHFIPFAQFKDRKPELKNSYSNLVFSCKKCNRTKAGKFKDSNNPNIIDNILFYDPGSVDFNTIFYRDNYGFIHSDDQKGKEMIKLLKLYNPFFGLAWIIEQINIIILRLNGLLSNSSNAETNVINSIIVDLSVKVVKLNSIFNSSFQDYHS